MTSEDIQEHATEHAVMLIRTYKGYDGLTAGEQTRAILNDVLDSDLDVQIIKAFNAFESEPDVNEDGYYAMVGYIMENKDVKHLYVYDTTAIAIDMEKFSERTRMFNDMGVEVHLHSQPDVELNTAEGRLMSFFENYGRSSLIADLMSIHSSDNLFDDTED